MHHTTKLNFTGDDLSFINTKIQEEPLLSVKEVDGADIEVTKYYGIKKIFTNEQIAANQKGLVDAAAAKKRDVKIRKFDQNELK